MDREIEWLLQEKYIGKKTFGFFADVLRLRAGEPLAYLIGYIPFLNTRIHLDSHPLIPRPETEYWTERTIEEMHDRVALEKKTSLAVLDLCAGSGCIGVAVLNAIPEAVVDFSEIDYRHHPTIQKNIHENHILNSRTHIFGGNLYDQITASYDVILTNPPYVDPTLSSRIAASVLAYEPHHALFGGTHGLELITNIIKDGRAHLHKNGVIIIEHEPEQEKAIHEIASVHGFFPKTHKDQFGTQRYTHLTRVTDEAVG